ncbi:MAG: 3-hydroxyacyl-CoA dehydrogenase family protein, partial [Flavobacteriales bacterium]
MKNITVIGAGTMGNGIAHVFAQNGFQVSLVDVSQKALDAALNTIAKNLDRQVAKGRLTEDQKLKTIGNLHSFTSLEKGASNADLVVEAATENIDLKLKIFRELELVCPDKTILA